MGGPGQAVKQGDEGTGIGLEVLFERGDVKVEEELHILGGDCGSHFGGEVPGVSLAGEFFQEFLAYAGAVAALAGEQPVLVATLAPAFKVVVGEVFAGVAKPRDDGFVSKAIEEQKVNGFADRRGETGDFAVAGFAGTPGGVREDGAAHSRIWIFDLAGRRV
jgi:hypothetical protein